MSPLTMPRVFTLGRWWSADELDALARRWRGEVLGRLGEQGGLVATALPASAEGVALFVGLSALPGPLVVLPPDVRAWRTAPAVPDGTPLILPPALRHLASAAQEAGLAPLLLHEPGEGPAMNAPPFVPLAGPGVVLFTSGSTGGPRAVYRPTAALLAGARARAAALRSGEGVLIGASLASAQGLNYLLVSMVLGGALGLLDPLDHRAALAALASPAFACWRASLHFADALGRCALVGPPVAPRLCLVSSLVPSAVCDAFLARFGVPLRQSYSSTETAFIASDDGPAAEVRPETVGRPLSGVAVRIGDDPAARAAPGEPGRIWVRTPWLMAGYGFPPAVERPVQVEGWWPTRDVGALREDGRLVLAGRLDDCIRTREGRLVNLAAVAATLGEMTGVTGAVVVPLDGPAGRSFGAVIECEPGVAVAALRTGLADKLPPWSWPRALEVVPSLPRLPNGKPDRLACVSLLARAPAR